jgi:sterol carrier protein 2
VNNNCATGSTALVHAVAFVRSGSIGAGEEEEEARCALALGFERMAPGPLGGSAKKSGGDDGRSSPLGPLFEAAARASPGSDRGPPNPRVFGAAAAEYFARFGGGVGPLAKIGEFASPPRFFFLMMDGWTDGRDWWVVVVWVVWLCCSGEKP